MGKSRFNKPDQDFTQDLSAGALSFTTTTNNKPFHLDQVTFKFSQSVTETITITLDSVKGTNYDAVLKVATISNDLSYVYNPESDAIFNAGDEIKVQCTADGGAGIVYGVVKTSEIN